MLQIFICGDDDNAGCYGMDDVQNVERGRYKNLDLHTAFINIVMSPSVSAALSNFLSALAGIGMSLVHSVFAVFQAIFALCTELLQGILSLGQSIVTLALDLFQGVFGFIAANLFAIIIIGGGYYVYTRRQRGRGVRIGQ